MNRQNQNQIQNQNQFGPPPPVKGGPGFQQLPAQRVPPHFMVPGPSELAAQTRTGLQKDAGQNPAGRWKHVSKSADGRDGHSSADSAELYDPSRPLSSDSESESPAHHPNAFASGPGTDPRRREPAGDGRRWESGVSRPDQTRSTLGAAGLKRDCQHPTGQDQDPPPAKVSRIRDQDPPPAKVSRIRDQDPPPAKVSRIRDQDPPPAKVSRIRDQTGNASRCPINCDICEVELANAQELEEHLDTSSHWETLEHIQQKKSYSDLVIAFLQEVMLCKSRHCSRAVEDGALSGLRDSDHMTRVEMFHCAACKVFTASSAEAVRSHVTSSEHLSNAQEFKVQQRRSCLYKAETMLKELRPQFHHFLKGGSLMEGHL